MLDKINEKITAYFTGVGTFSISSVTYAQVQNTLSIVGMVLGIIYTLYRLIRDIREDMQSKEECKKCSPKR